MSKRPVNINHYAVVDYWASRSEQLHRASWSFEKLDIHHCFACDFDHGERRPQRHHIIPYEFSQNDDPSNIHLLCERCHRDAPHTPNTDIYWTWFHSKEDWFRAYAAAMTKAFAKSGLTEDDCETLMKLITPEKGVEIFGELKLQNRLRLSLETLMLTFLTVLKAQLPKPPGPRMIEVPGELRFEDNDALPALSTDLPV